MQKLDLKNNNRLFSSNKSAFAIQTLDKDTFQKRSDIPFKATLHIPVEEVRTVFAKGLSEIEKARTFEEKLALANKCFDSYKAIWDRTRQPLEEYRELTKDTAAILQDRAHEIGNAKMVLQRLRNPELRKLTNEPFDQSCKNSFNTIMGIIERYELFLTEGLVGGTSPLKNIFKLVMDYAGPLAKDKNIQINPSGTDILNSNTSGLRRANFRLYTIFSNILQNAVKYSPDNSSIEVEFAENEFGKMKQFVFSVTDQGIGIPPTEQENVLRGKRASNAVASGIGGTGYGLYRANEVMKDSLARLRIVSPVNPSNADFPGTKIVCEFPIFHKMKS